MFRWFRRDEMDAKAAAMRRVHEQWLTRAIRRGRGLPTIPTRAVSNDWSGGYSSVMATPEGREWAAEYWSITLSDDRLG